MSIPKFKEETEFETEAIKSLREAARLISQSLAVLKSNTPNYQATNLPVSDAVDHVTSCLVKDAAYLEKLAEICEESSSIIRKFEE